MSKKCVFSKYFALNYKNVLIQSNMNIKNKVNNSHNNLQWKEEQFENIKVVQSIYVKNNQTGNKLQNNFQVVL